MIDAIANMYPVLMVSVLGNSTEHVSEKPARTANSATTLHAGESPAHANPVAEIERAGSDCQAEGSDASGVLSAHESVPCHA